MTFGFTYDEQGETSEKSMKKKEMMKHLRADIRQAVADGVLPADLTARVRKSRGGVVDVLLDFSAGWEVVEATQSRMRDYWGRSHVVQLTDAALATLKAVEGLAWRYNRDPSNTQVGKPGTPFDFFVTTARGHLDLTASDLAGMKPAEAAVFAEFYFNKLASAGTALKLAGLVVAESVQTYNQPGEAQDRHPVTELATEDD